MMKTVVARTVDRSAIASTTARNNAISPPISSVACVAMLVIWLAIARIANAARTGATTVPVQLLEDLVPLDWATEMLWTANTRYVDFISHMRVCCC